MKLRLWMLGVAGLILAPAVCAQTLWQPTYTFPYADAHIVHLQAIGDKLVVGTTMGSLHRSKPDGTLEAVLLVFGNTVSEVAVKDQQHWLVGGEASIYFTHDGGTTWDMEITPFDRMASATAWVGDVMFVGTDDYPDMRNGGTGLGIWRTADQGRTWETVNQGIGNDSYVTKMVTDPSGQVWAAIHHVHYDPSDGLYRWNETENRWDHVSLGMFDGDGNQLYAATSLSVYAFSVLPDGSIWVGFDGVCSNFACSGMNRSTDGGKTWTSVNGIPDLQSPQQPVMNDVIFDPENGLMGPLANYNRGFAYMNGDNGWTMRRELPHSPNPYETYRMAATSDGQIWAGRRLDKTIYRLQRLGTGLDEERPTPFQIGAHPNPFNPTTSITLEMPAHGRARIHVYDLLGRHVATLADGDFTAGSHRITWEAKGAASGIYLIRVTVGAHVQSIKATLVR